MWSIFARRLENRNFGDSGSHFRVFRRPECITEMDSKLGFSASNRLKTQKIHFLDRKSINICFTFSIFQTSDHHCRNQIDCMNVYCFFIVLRCCGQQSRNQVLVNQLTITSFFEFMTKKALTLSINSIKNTKLFRV